MAQLESLQQAIIEKFKNQVACVIDREELTIQVPAVKILDVCLVLRDAPEFYFEQLIDICGVDYLQYAKDEWATSEATNTGFSRGVGYDRAAQTLNEVPDANNHAEEQTDEISAPKTEFPERFAVVYHLLSVKHNQRVRLKVFLPEDNLIVPSVVGIWAAANWFEREAFDLYGILFSDHPDLRRILTDYGFIGHPFRKDFPLIGEVEMRFDEQQQRIVYEPVSIEPRTLVPKTIREDSRFENPAAQEQTNG